MKKLILKRAPLIKSEVKQQIIEEKEIFNEERKEKIHSKNYYKMKKLVLGNGEKDGIIFEVFIYIFLILLSYIFLEPLLQMLFTSFKSASDVIDPEVIYLPKHFSINNYKVAFKVLDYTKSLFNSIWFSALLAILQTIVSALAGYAFARYEFKGKKFWYGLLIVAFIVPIQVLIIPRRMIISIFQKVTGIVVMSTIVPQIVFTLLGQGIYSTILILIFINFFKQIPIALDEAAVMDGASTWQTFTQITLKLSASIIFTVFLFSFVWNWNDVTSMTFFLGGRLKLLPTQLESFEAAYSKAEAKSKTVEAYKMAGSFLSILPLIILYIFVQKKFVEGIENTGMTGM